MHFDHESVIKDNCISPRMLKKVIFIKNGWLFENKLILHNNKKNSRKTAFNVLITKKWAMVQPWGKRWIVENYLRSPKLIFKIFFELYCVKARIFINFESIGITVRRRRAVGERRAALCLSRSHGQCLSTRYSNNTIFQIDFYQQLFDLET